MIDGRVIAAILQRSSGLFAEVGVGQSILQASGSTCQRTIAAKTSS